MVHTYLFWNTRTGLATEITERYDDCPDAEKQLGQGKWEYSGWVEGNRCPSCGGTGTHRKVTKRSQRLLSKKELKAAQRAARKAMDD
jgi:excinuclease UvrABC ATPase subunit